MCQRIGIPSDFITINSIRQTLSTWGIGHTEEVLLSYFDKNPAGQRQGPGFLVLVFSLTFHLIVQINHSTNLQLPNEYYCSG